MKQDNKKYLLVINKLYYILSFFLRNIFGLTIFAVVVLTLSQLFLIISYLLPIKIILLLSVETIPDFLRIIFNELKRDHIILILSFSVFASYGMHLIFEKMILNVISRSLKVIVLEKKNPKQVKILFRFLESFFRLMSTFTLVFLLYCTLVYLFPIIAISLLLYLLIVIIIFPLIKIEKEKLLHFFKTSFFLGFMIIFLFEIIYLLYFYNGELSIFVILISMIIVRYIFLRGVFIVNKLLVLHRGLNTFNKILGID